ncbi:DUF2892 domain-containing protein [uncultured Jannaschia sp.]|uniref:YgaP family membrane protein n=1 Tax=uncultured Jannaschia sp. TaxID=293347 RepID=UPI0026121674|nr:DUF2892 domain-containing protein [uncultured Jannaschia sp.]
MQVNVGQADRIIRIVLGFALILAPLLNLPAIWSSGVWSYASIIIGSVLVVTALVRMCPLYSLAGINTCKA